MPTFEVKPAYFARALAAGALVTIGGVLLWTAFSFLFRGIPYVSSLVAIAVGYAAGELISLSVNRKRGIGLAWIAGGAVVVTYLVSLKLGYADFGLLPLFLLFVATFIAVQRVR